MKASLIIAFSYLFLSSFSSYSQSNVSIAKLNGIQLEYIDTGAGSANIIIESGIGMGVNYWQPLLENLKQQNFRVIIYSRAGNGKSSQLDDVSLNISNKRLEHLLAYLNIKNNIILVGHSYGGLHARQFAANFPEKVRGIVLLDPSHELFSKELKKQNKHWAEKDDEKLNRIMNGNQEWFELQKEYSKGMLLDGGEISLIPTVIITSSKIAESDWWIGHSEIGKKIWRKLHASLIESNPNSTHIITNTVGHNIPIEKPSLVISSINQLLLILDNNIAL